MRVLNSEVEMRRKIEKLIEEEGLYNGLIVGKWKVFEIKNGEIFEKWKYDVKLYLMLFFFLIAFVGVVIINAKIFSVDVKKNKLPERKVSVVNKSHLDENGKQRFGKKVESDNNLDGSNLKKYPGGKLVSVAREKSRESEEKKKAKKIEEEESFWNKVVKENNIDGYREYIKRYPGGIHFDIAKRRVKEILKKKKEDEFWKKVEREDSIEGYLSYLEKYPNGKYAEIARNRRDKLIELRAINEEREFWKRIKEENTIQSYEEYLRKYPDGTFSWEAKERIRKIQKEEEDNFWKSVKYENTIDAYKRYLERFPDGRYVDVAKISIEELRKKEIEERERENWEKVSREESIEGYESYLRRYPNGRYAKEARKKLKKLKDWNSAISDGSVEALFDYYLKYGDHKQEILYRIGDGETLLINCSKEGNLKCVKSLLALGISPDCKDNEEWTPLHWAVWKGHFEVVKCLVEHDADPYLKTIDGDNAFDLAKWKGRKKILRYLKSH